MKRFSFLIRFALIAIPIGAQVQNQSAPLRVAMHDKPWVFQIVAPGFKVEQNGVPKNGRSSLSATDAPFDLSVTLERVNGTATLDGCKARLQPNAPFKVTNVKRTQTAGMAVMGIHDSEDRRFTGRTKECNRMHLERRRVR